MAPAARERADWLSRAGRKPLDNFYAHFDLPGVRAESITLTVEHNVPAARAGVTLRDGRARRGRLLADQGVFMGMPLCVPAATRSKAKRMTMRITAPQPSISPASARPAPFSPVRLI